MNMEGDENFAHCCFVFCFKGFFSLSCNEAGWILILYALQIPQGSP